MQSKVVMFFVNFMKNDVKPTSATIVAMVTEEYTEIIVFTELLKISKISKFQGICIVISKVMTFFVNLMQKGEKPSYFEFR